MTNDEPPFHTLYITGHPNYWSAVAEVVVILLNVFKDKTGVKAQTKGVKKNR